jgi:hypothetical protein
MYILQEKSDTHDTYALTTSHTWQTFTLIQQSWTESLLLRKRAPVLIHSTSADRFVGPHPVSLPRTAIKAVEKAKLLLMSRLHQFTGSISPAWHQYVQYLLRGVGGGEGVNPSVLNQHRWGLPPWRCWLSISLSPPFPSNDPALSPNGLVRSQVNILNINL